ncbi:MAG: PAS domain S-box protein [Ignavibacteriales bacterium]|nr:MAG: PAS domain S-box protein [Ignavibacteriales bacterium]
MPENIGTTIKYNFLNLKLTFSKASGRISKDSVKLLSSILPAIESNKDLFVSDLFSGSFIKSLDKFYEQTGKKKAQVVNTKLIAERKTKIPVQVGISVKGKTHQLVINSISDRNPKSAKADQSVRKAIHPAERFHILFENNPLMIFALDTDGNILTTNSKVKEYLGFENKKLQGKNFSELLESDEHKKFSQHLDKCLRRMNKMFTREIKMLRRDGTSIWAGEHSCAFKDLEGKNEILIVCDDITIKKKKEDELRLSEEKFFKAFHISPDSININTVSEGKYLDVNQGFESLTGYSKDEVIGRTSREINIWDDINERQKLVAFLSKSGEVTDFEAAFRLKDGKVRIGLMSARLIKVENEICILSITRDITERKKAEQILVENEIKYKALFDHANDAIFIMKDDIFVDCNTRTLEIFKCNRSEILGQNPFKFSPIFQPDGKFSDAKGMTLIHKALNGLPQFFEWKHSRLDGELFDAEVSLNKVEFGNEIYLQAIVRDVTDRKGAESKITLLAHALKSISECVSITDMSDNIIFLNDAFVSTYGYTEEELIGKPITRVRSFNNPPEKTADILNDTLRGGWQGELLNVKKDGTEFYVYLSTSVIRDDNGKEIALIGVSSDVTERKKAQEELVAAKQRAEEMNKLKSSFLANMSHELRTPLVGILGFAEMILDEDNTGEKKLMTEMILNSGRRLLDTLNSLLDLARIEANKIELNYKKFILDELIENTVKAFDGFAYTKNLSLETSLNTSALEVYLDENILVQVINNLVNNALKYTLKGGVKVESDIFTENEIRHCRIKVIDTGIGIEDKSKEMIFEEFRQASEGFNRQFEGTGLGLTLTKKFVQMMNGKIYLESRVNVGSTFTVIFPCKESVHQQSGEVIERFPEKKVTEVKNTPGAKILLVENDIVSAEVTKYFLRNRYEIHSCEDGVTAIQLTNKYLYDVILMDINLGKDLSGIETVQMIRNLPAYKSTPIVALTAFAMEGDKNEFIASGCSHYLSKPFSKTSILDLLSQILSGKTE